MEKSTSAIHGISGFYTILFSLRKRPPHGFFFWHFAQNLLESCKNSRISNVFVVILFFKKDIVVCITYTMNIIFEPFRQFSLLLQNSTRTSNDLTRDFFYLKSRKFLQIFWKNEG